MAARTPNNLSVGRLSRQRQAKRRWPDGSSSRPPILPHKLEEADGVAQRVDVAGVVAIVNGTDGKTDYPMTGARGLDEHFGFGLEPRRRERPQSVPAKPTVNG